MVFIVKIVLLTNDNYFSYIATEKFFKNYKSDIRETGPGDNHKNWIWVQVEK